MADASLPLHLLRTGILPGGRIGRPDGAPGVHVGEVTGFAAAMIVARKGKSSSTASKLTDTFGVSVEDRPKRVAKGHISITGIAPGSWLAVQRDGTDLEFAERLAAVLNGAAAVTAQGNGRIIIEISGPKARATLAKGIPVDLDPSVFAVGAAAQTTASHIGVGLALLDTVPTFELVSNASTRGSLLTWLVTSAAEFGLDVA